MCIRDSIYILAWTGNERLLYIATLHDHNHRLSLAFCYQVVHDVDVYKRQTLDMEYSSFFIVLI